MNDRSQIQLRHLFKVFSGSTPESGNGYYWDGDIYWVTPEDVSSLKEDYRLCDTRRKITVEGYENSGVNIVPENSIVLTKRAPIGLLAILGIEACSNQGCFLLVPKEEVVSEFYYYYLLAKKDYLQVLGRGSTFMELSQDDLKPLKIPYVATKKQRIISNFLDRETKRIDRLIKEKENQLSLLAEKRQTIITHAVTKGLNPNVKLKNSGIEWLGEIPQHWKVKKLKYVAYVNPTLKTYEFDKESNEEIVFLPMENVSEFGEVDTSIRRPISDVSSGYTYFEKNDVVVAKITPCFENGKGAWLHDLETNFGFGTTEFHILRSSEQIDSEFLYLITTSTTFRKWGTAVMKGAAGQKRVTPDFIKEYPVTFPEINEQREIIRKLKRELYKLEQMKSLTKESVKLLAEKKVALIAITVIG